AGTIQFERHALAELDLLHVRRLPAHAATGEAGEQGETDAQAGGGVHGITITRPAAAGHPLPPRPVRVNGWVHRVQAEAIPVLHVGPDAKVTRPRQPDARVVAFIEKVPGPVFSERSRRAERARWDRCAVRLADVELPHPLPGEAVARAEQVGLVLAALGEQVI